MFASSRPETKKFVYSGLLQLTPQELIQGTLNIFNDLLCYSSLPNKRTDPNKRTGWNFDKNQISVQGEILIKILECRVKTGNFDHNKRDS